MENPESHEIAVLGACLVEPACYIAIADYIRPDDFYSEAHREIYGAIHSLGIIGEPINDVTVSEELRRKKKLTLAGGASYISTIVSQLPDTANVDFYAKAVKNAAVCRSLQRLGTRLTSVEGDPAEAISEALERLVDVSAGSMRSVPESIGEHTSRVYRRAIAINNGEEERKALLTMLPRFDRITGGLKGSDLIIIGARPSVGKSAFGLFLSKILAERGSRVLFFSLEMSSEQIATRMLAAESGVPYSRISEGYLSKKDPELLEAANRMYTNLPLVIDDRAGQSVTDIQVKARRESVRGGLDLVVVDYLQIAARDSTSYEEVTAVSNGLKKLAKDLDIPVIALSQLSRMIEQRDNKRPTLSDLKQSGGLEQDADLVGMLHYPDRRKMNEIEFDVIKHRNGELGRVLFNFQKNIQTFEEIGGGSDD